MPVIGGLPNAPAPASFSAPQVDFSPLSKLADLYFKGTQEARQLGMQQAQQEGIPKNPDGSPNLSLYAQTLAKWGDNSLLQAGLPKFGPISKDFMGGEQMGFVSPLTQTVTPAASAHGTPSSTVGSGSVSSALYGPDGQPLVGQELLESLKRTNPMLAAGVEGVYRGDINAAGRNLQKILPLVKLVYPDFTQQDFANRAAIQKSFNNGPDSVKVTSFNQALNHAAYAYQLIQKLPNVNYAPGILNPAIQTYKDWTGDKQFQETRRELQSAINALATELTKAFSGNVPAQTEIEHWREAMNIKDSPNGLIGGIKGAMRLLGGGLEAATEKWNNGTKSARESRSFLWGNNPELFQRLSAGQPIDDIVQRQHGVPGKPAAGPGGGASTAPQVPPRPASKSDAQLLAEAKATIAQRPDLRDKVISGLKAWNVNPAGL